MRGFHNSSFDPPTLVLLETAFDEAWLTLKSIGNTTVKPDELARCVLRLAREWPFSHWPCRSCARSSEHAGRHEQGLQDCPRCGTT